MLLLPSCDWTGEVYHLCCPLLHNTEHAIHHSTLFSLSSNLYVAWKIKNCIVFNIISLFDLFILRYLRPFIEIAPECWEFFNLSNSTLFYSIPSYLVLISFQIHNSFISSLHLYCAHHVLHVLSGTVLWLASNN